MTVPKMMPGQEPYTDAEWSQVASLIHDVAGLHEQMSAEELDELEREIERKRREKGSG